MGKKATRLSLSPSSSQMASISLGCITSPRKQPPCTTWTLTSCRNMLLLPARTETSGEGTFLCRLRLNPYWGHLSLPSSGVPVGSHCRLDHLPFLSQGVQHGQREAEVLLQGLARRQWLLVEGKRAISTRRQLSGHLQQLPWRRVGGGESCGGAGLLEVLKGLGLSHWYPQGKSCRPEGAGGVGQRSRRPSARSRSWVGAIPCPSTS